jgi:peroxiredoxin
MLSLLVSAALAATPAAVVGQPAPDFSLPAADGRTVRLADLRGQTVVLEWFNPDCPFVKYAYAEGPQPELAVDWTGKKVTWVGINSGAPGKQGAGKDRNVKAVAEYGITWPILLDESGAVGRSYGAKTTPQVFVVDPKGVLVYAGALDNAPLGKVEGAGARVDYTSGALTTALAGGAPNPAETKPYGCSVKYKR